MIRYTKGTWQTFFYWWGGINRHLLPTCIKYLIFLVALYCLQMKEQVFQNWPDTGGLHMLGSLTVFLLVFRMNQSMARNNEANERSDKLFSNLERLAQEVCSCMHGSKDEDLSAKFLRPAKVTDSYVEEVRLYADLAGAMRIHCTRLILALAVSFLLHCVILAAVSDDQGILEEEMMSQIIFLHSRLQALLYAEEMELVDRAMPISCEKLHTGEYVYRAEVGRYRIVGKHEDALMVPDRASIDELVPPESGIVPTVPKVVMTMLVDALYVPLSQPWGYPERVLNIIHGTCDDVMNQVTHLSGLIARPVSLAYYQHCRVILVMYAFLWPFVTEVGDEPNFATICNNIVFPFCAFWAMTGLEKLAEMMENPLGSDDTDIHLMEMLHDLEVSLHLAFDMSEKYRPGLRRCLYKAIETRNPEIQDYLAKPSITPRRKFEDHFVWLPIPSIIAEEMLLKHGHAEHSHSAFIEGHFLDVRGFIRRALRRHSHGQKTVYEGVSQDSSNEGANLHEEAAAHTTIGLVQRNPTSFWHYLAYRPVIDGHCPGEQGRQAAWKERMMSHLDPEHPAAPLLTTSGDDDSARSVVLHPIQRRDRSFLSPADEHKAMMQQSSMGVLASQASPRDRTTSISERQEVLQQALALAKQQDRQPSKSSSANKNEELRKVEVIPPPAPPDTVETTVILHQVASSQPLEVASSQPLVQGTFGANNDPIYIGSPFVSVSLPALDLDTSANS